MKNLFYIVFCFICCSCQWTNSPDDIIDESSKYRSYCEYDTIDLKIGIKKLPYINENIKIYSDSCYFNDSNIKINNEKVTVYKNAVIKIDVLNYYKINKIKWLNTDMAKVIELVHTPTNRMYWCGDDVYLDSVNIVLIKEERKVTICG